MEYKMSFLLFGHIIIGLKKLPIKLMQKLKSHIMFIRFLMIERDTLKFKKMIVMISISNNLRVHILRNIQKQFN